MSNCSFLHLKKSNLLIFAHSLFLKEQLKDQKSNCSFEKSKKAMRKRAIEQLPNGPWQSLLLKITIFRLGEGWRDYRSPPGCTVYENERSLFYRSFTAFALFCSFCSFALFERAIDLAIALMKRAIKRAISLLKSATKRAIVQLFF